MRENITLHYSKKHVGIHSPETCMHHISYMHALILAPHTDFAPLFLYICYSPLLLHLYK